MIKDPKKENIHREHRKRMRQKYLSAGMAGFKSHEIAELLLYNVMPQINLNDTAHDMINTFGSVYGMISNYTEECGLTFRGIPKDSYVFFGFIRELYEKKFKENSLGGGYMRYSETLSITEYIRVLFATHLKGEPDECFSIMLFSNDMSLLRTKNICIRFSTEEFIKEAVSLAVCEQASYIAAAHRLPDDFPMFMSEDAVILGRISEVFGIIGIDMLDYMIIGEKRSISLREFRPNAFGT